VPIYEYWCQPCGEVEEMYRKRYGEPPPPCPRCGAERITLASRFAVVFTGDITSRYKLKDREDAYTDGVWMYRKRTSLSGEPEPVYIQTWQELREFCKAEGLSQPGEAPTNASISSDGKRLSGAGMPGQWATFSPEVLPEKATAPPPDPQQAAPLLEVTDRRSLDPKANPQVMVVDAAKAQAAIEKGEPLTSAVEETVAA
jgi:putative FmdB family regulatory protein